MASSFVRHASMYVDACGTLNCNFYSFYSSVYRGLISAQLPIALVLFHSRLSHAHTHKHIIPLNLEWITDSNRICIYGYKSVIWSRLLFGIAIYAVNWLTKSPRCLLLFWRRRLLLLLFLLLLLLLFLIVYAHPIRMLAQIAFHGSKRFR